MYSGRHHITAGTRLNVGPGFKVQLTGVASRHVGYYIAAILMLLGLFPIIGGVLQQIPKPVLGVMTPDLLSQMPKMVQSIFGSPITTGGLAAILLCLLLPAPATVDIEEQTAVSDEGALTADALCTPSGLNDLPGKNVTNREPVD